MGFTGLVLGTMLQRDGVVKASDHSSWAPPDGAPHFAPRAKNVIWIYLSGGYSHLETFDPKPALNKYAGKTYAGTPFTSPVLSPLTAQRGRNVVDGLGVVSADAKSRLFPLQVGYRRHGESGIAISDWWPHLARCADDLAIVRSMYTTDNDHAAMNQFHTGRHKLDETQPSIGAWVHYGLGSLNDNLPQFVVLGEFKDSRMKFDAQSYYLGPEHAGIRIKVDPEDPLPFATAGAEVLGAAQRNEFRLVDRLNRIAAVQYPDDLQMRARIRSYELAFGMQTAVPEALDVASPTPQEEALYGLDNDTTREAGRHLLAARRLVERGVRFVQIYPTDYGVWDSHRELKKNHTAASAKVDRPVAGLLSDLKQRGLLAETLVVFGTEFGRTPAMEVRDKDGWVPDGRDHHPYGFSVWLAGAGIKGGIVHGATDELGFHAVEHPHYVTDLHATVLHLLGLDSRQLEVPGRKRLEIDLGRPIKEIMA